MIPGGEDAQRWISGFVQPTGPMEVFHERPWATVVRVPVAHGKSCWFKICAPIQAFETRLTADLFARWPDRVSEVLGHDEARSWLLLGDAGTRLGDIGNPPEVWLGVLPLYGELQRGEAVHASEHLAHGVPDLRLRLLPDRYEDLLRTDLPLEPVEIQRLRDVAPRFQTLCDELEGFGIPETIQHDDLHMGNVYVDGGRFRVLDWGDSCVSHPFFSLVETFRFLEELNGLTPDDRWFSRLADAYLEGWEREAPSAFPLALEVGAFAHAIAWIRQRDALPAEARPEFDRAFSVVLRRALKGRRLEAHDVRGRS